MTDLITRLRAYTDHRGDGIPTQPVNPDGEEAADRIEALERELTNEKCRLATVQQDHADCEWLRVSWFRHLISGGMTGNQAADLMADAKRDYHQRHLSPSGGEAN